MKPELTLKNAQRELTSVQQQRPLITKENEDVTGRPKEQLQRQTYRSALLTIIG
jgi:hypothetical protein